MTESELLFKVKAALMITGTQFDDVLKLHIANVKDFMISSGVKKSVVDDGVSVGCILTGVNDLWNNNSGGVKFSDFFMKRLTQLCYEDEKPVPLATYVACVPTIETAATFGWILKEGSYGFFAKNLTDRELTINDDQILKVTMVTTDGTVYTGENTSTGSRRYTVLNGSRVGVFPRTIYDLTQSKFIDSDDTTTLSVPLDCAGTSLTFEVFER